MIIINHKIRIPLKEIEFSFVRSSGPGGQKVNKTNSCVLLRWNLGKSKSLAEATRNLLQSKLSARMTEEGEILIKSQRFRDRSRNVADALEKLRALLLKASHVPKKRRPTKVPKRAKEQRLSDKKALSERKRQRRQKFD